MGRRYLARMDTVTALPKKDRAPGPSIFDDPEVLAELMDRSFHEAKREAIAENDRLGVPSYGTRGGKRVVRQPPKAKPGSGPS